MAENNDYDDMVLDGTLGCGAFGKVYLCHNANNEDEKYALKVINLCRATREERKNAAMEAHILSKLDHPNVIQHFETFEKEGALCILTEYCDRGNLLNFLERRKGKLLEEERISIWFKQMCKGLEYMHDNMFLHRDVKTENIFLCGENLTAKLGDVGLAKVMDSPTALALTFCGSPYYMSPEMFSMVPYGFKSDVWALGVIIYELITLDKPFDATVIQRLSNKVIHGEIPQMPTEKYSKDLIHLIEKMLSKSPDARPSCTEILISPFFKPKRPLPPLPREVTAKGNDMIKSVRGSQKELEKSVEMEEFKLFDIKNLVDTLSLVRRKKKEMMEKTLTNKDNNPAEKYKMGAGALVGAGISLSGVIVNFENTLSLKESVKALPSPNKPDEMMRTVVRKYIDLKHKGKPPEQKPKEEPKSEENGWTDLLSLQASCTEELGDELFRRAYDVLGSSNNENEIEKQLKGLLSREQFNNVGQKLLFCRTLETALTDGGSDQVV